VGDTTTEQPAADTAAASGVSPVASVAASTNAATAGALPFTGMGLLGTAFTGIITLLLGVASIGAAGRRS
jgi:hypothetical protein